MSINDFHAAQRQAFEAAFPATGNHPTVTIEGLTPEQQYSLDCIVAEWQSLIHLATTGVETLTLSLKNAEDEIARLRSAIASQKAGQE